MTPLQPKNSSLLERLRLFVVTARENLSYLDTRPFGLPRAEHVDPLSSSSHEFHELMKRLDTACFGPTGMPMPSWMYLAGTELTGAVVGFGIPRRDCTEAICELLEVPPGYTGLVPLAVFMAIPTYSPGYWFAHNLASLGPHLQQADLRGLGGLTKAVGLKVLRAEVQVGATQWDSVALFVHTRLGVLELITAYTPAHSDDLTLTYKTPITDSQLYCVADDPRGRRVELEPTEWIAGDDAERIRTLQAEIEAGATVHIVGRPRREDGGQLVPIRIERVPS